MLAKIPVFGRHSPPNTERHISERLDSQLEAFRSVPRLPHRMPHSQIVHQVAAQVEACECTIEPEQARNRESRQVPQALIGEVNREDRIRARELSGRQGAPVEPRPNGGTKLV